MLFIEVHQRVHVLTMLWLPSMEILRALLWLLYMTSQEATALGSKKKVEMGKFQEPIAQKKYFEFSTS